MARYNREGKVAKRLAEPANGAYERPDANCYEVRPATPEGPEYWLRDNGLTGTNTAIARACFLSVGYGEQSVYAHVDGTERCIFIAGADGSRTYSANVVRAVQEAEHAVSTAETAVATLRTIAAEVAAKAGR